MKRDRSGAHALAASAPRSGLVLYRSAIYFRGVDGRIASVAKSGGAPVDTGVGEIDLGSSKSTIRRSIGSRGSLTSASSKLAGSGRPAANLHVFLAIAFCRQQRGKCILDVVEAFLVGDLQLQGGTEIGHRAHEAH